MVCWIRDSWDGGAITVLSVRVDCSVACGSSVGMRFVGMHDDGDGCVCACWL